mgnify:CR=1 FL=1
MPRRPRRRLPRLPLVAAGGEVGDEGGVAERPDAGKNRPNGLIVNYWLKAKPKADVPVTIEFLEGDNDWPAVMKWTGYVHVRKVLKTVWKQHLHFHKQDLSTKWWLWALLPSVYSR